MINQNPKYSIIIPVYNVEKYIDACIDSVITQTYSNFEAIFIDDGSTDQSGKIIDKRCSSDPRIKIIHKSNRGPAQARNSGLELATGEYVIFLDSDDKLTTNALEIFNKAFEKYPEAEWIRGNNLVSSPDGSVRDEDLHEKRSPYLDRYLKQDEWWDHIVNAGEVWGYAFLHNKIKDMNLIFNPKLRTGEDGLWLLDYTKTGKGVYISDVVYDYLFQRRDGLSFTRARTEADCISIIECASQWKIKSQEYSGNPIMNRICNHNLRQRVRNGIGGFAFVEKNLRVPYVKKMKLIAPQIVIRGGFRETIKAILYNYFPWGFYFL